MGGDVWRFNTRQFRRTLAWYIANRPFGVVAGKIQYKHASVAMFGGYAGSSASGFRQEVEQELALGQLDDIINYFENHRRGHGPGDRPASVSGPNWKGSVANSARFRDKWPIGSA